MILIQTAVLTSTSGSLFPAGFLCWSSFGSTKLTKTADLSYRGVPKQVDSTFSTLLVEKVKKLYLRALHPLLIYKGETNLTLL